MKPFANWSDAWVFYLTAALLFGATALRSLLIYAEHPVLGQALALLALWLILLIASEAPFVRKRPAVFPLYLILQTILVLALLFMPESSDFNAVLFAVLSMQIMQRMSARIGAVCLGLFAPLMTFPLVQTYGVGNGIAFALLFTFANVLLALYALATRRAQTARSNNQSLAQELEQANRQLQTYARQVEQLAIARERHRLARELHDSVTQTIFSMTLTTQSALLLLERDPSRVGLQLDRLNELAQGALAEMRVLISELRPGQLIEGGLISALRAHLASRNIPDDLVISLQVEGDQALEPAEEQCLFRIAQEAVHNIVKHAQASQACIRLHLAPPMWIEIQDEGRGFDLGQMGRHGVGLVNMRERAAEIGWNLEITTTIGASTRIRVEKRWA